MINPEAIPNGNIIILGELGYFGKHRAKIYKGLYEKFGKDSWQTRWVIEGNLENLQTALQNYEDSYFHFLINNPKILNWLISTASDVYDIQPSDVNSGLDYYKQECDATHYQDIAVRRVLERLGKKFEGNHLVQIRGHETEGYVLNPGKVPFHRPKIILPRETESWFWWNKDSVEAFYQQNKALLVNPDRLLVKAEIQGPEGVFYHHTKSVYYLPDEADPRILWKHKGRNVRMKLNQQPSQYKQLKDSELRPYSEFI